MTQLTTIFANIKLSVTVLLIWYDFDFSCYVYSAFIAFPKMRLNTEKLT